MQGDIRKPDERRSLQRQIRRELLDADLRTLRAVLSFILGTKCRE